MCDRHFKDMNPNMKIETTTTSDNVSAVALSDVLCHAEILAERREMLCKKPPTCPDCKTEQVQLTEWIEGEVAEWKCRHCRTRFKFERVA